MKLWATAALAAGVVALPVAAWADCEIAPKADAAVVAVPKGKHVRVMYLRPGPYNNYVEVCSRPFLGAAWEREHGEFANASDWYVLWTEVAQAADYQINVLGAQVTDRDPVAWRGMRRTVTPTGVTFAFHDNMPDAPNTIVEVCIHSGNEAECPGH